MHAYTYLKNSNGGLILAKIAYRQSLLLANISSYTVYTYILVQEVI